MQSLELPHDLATDRKDALDHLSSLPGVSFVALMDREGFVMECAGRLAGDADAVTAMASCLLETSEGLAREVGHGTLRCAISEFDDGLVLAMGDAASSRLAVVLHDLAALDTVRRHARELVAALPCTL